MKKDVVAIIKSCKPFDSASVDNLTSALSLECCFEKTYQKKEMICSPFDNEKKIVVILSGSASVHSADTGKSVLLRTLHKSDVFGVSNLFDYDESFVSHVTANQTCRALIIGADAISYLLQNDHNFMYSYISFLSGRIRFLNQKITFYTSGSAERRIALYLSSFNSETIVPPLSMNLIAELLDISRASLYRGFDKLIEDGFIKRDGETIIILDHQKMIKYFNL